MPDAITFPPRALLAWRVEAVVVTAVLGVIGFVVGWVWMDLSGVRTALLAGGAVAIAWLVIEVLVLVPRRHAAWRARFDGTVFEVADGARCRSDRARRRRRAGP